MEARGGLNGDQNVRNSWKINDLLSGALQGRVRGGFWMDLGRILGGFWRDSGGRGARMETKINKFRGLFTTPSQGRVWGGSWMDLGRILGGAFDDFSNFS